MGDLSGALVVIAVLGFIALLIKWGGMGHYAQMQMSFEMRKQILDKLGTGPEVKQFIESKEGKEFFESLKISQPTQPKKHTSAEILGYIIIFMCIGFIGVFGGVGFLIAGHFISDPEYLIPGFVITGVGIGFLVTAWISYHLNRKWGIIKKEAAESPGART